MNPTWKLDFPEGSDSKDVCWIPGLGRSLGKGNGNLLQYPCLENPMDRGAWWATGHGVTKSQTQLSYFHFHFIISHFNPSSCTFWSPSPLPRAEESSGLLPPNSGFSSLGISTLTSVTTTPNLRKAKGGSLQILLPSEVRLFSPKELHSITP